MSGNTWSEVIQRWSRELPIIPYAFGVLGGHWFTVRPEGLLLGTPESAYALGATGVSMLVVSIAFKLMNYSIPAGWIFVLLGMIAGHFFWAPIR